MIRTKEAKDASVSTFYYEDPSVNSRETAAAWIVKAASLAEMQPGYIMLRDLENRSEEGNQSCRLTGTAKAEEILEALEGKSIGRIFLIGKYKGGKAGFGVDLTAFELAVTLRNGDLALLSDIERDLA